MSSPGTGSFGARLDRLPWTGVQTRIALALGAGWLFDSFEVHLVASVINPLQEDFGYGPLVGQFVIFSWLAGILLGAMAGGRLADRLGRRRLFVASLLWYAGFTVVTALSPAITVVIVLRFLTGLGVGAEYSVINSALSELVPARHRGKAGVLVMNFWPVGAIASGLLAYGLLETLSLPGSVAWRYAFALGGVVALLVLFFRRAVPESPRWLASQARPGDAEVVVAGLERRSGVQPGETGPDDRATEESCSPGLWAATRELLARYRGRLALGSLLDLSEAFGYYGIFAIVPLVVLPAVGVPDAEVPLFLVLGNLGALAGGLLVAFVFDRLGRHWTVAGCYLLSAAGVGALAAATSTGGAVLVLAAFMLSNLLATAAWTGAYPAFTELFPTHLRGAGAGVSVAVGRTGAMFSVVAVTTVAETVSITAGYLIVVGFWLVGTAAMVTFAAGGGVEGAQQSLETVTAGRDER